MVKHLFLKINIKQNITADMFPPGTDFIIAYMDSFPVLAGSENCKNQW